MKTRTKLASLGRNVKKDFGAVNPPVLRTSTLIFDDFEQMQAYEAGKGGHYGYARMGNETMQRLCDTICELEGGDYTLVTASGLAATVLALNTFLKTGDHILAPDSIYASTRTFCEIELPRCGVEVTFYDPTIGADIESLMQDNTRVVYVESPGSLTFEVQDVPAIAEVAHRHGAIVIGDNTWGTPLYLDAFALGMDVSIQSVTKYMAGHSDLTMGSITVKEQHRKQLYKTYYNYGPAVASDNAYLALRGLRSMLTRLQAQEKTALEIAQWLEARDEVVRVLYPALPSHPGHELWKRDLTGACSLFAFEIKEAGREQIKAFVDSLEHFGLGYSWGGYESLVTVYRPAKNRSATQWDEHCWLVRLHIGLEDAEDLKDDLDRAFSKV